MLLSDQPRIVVTGLGIVSPLGGNAAKVWRGLNELESVNSAPVTSGRAPFSGKISDFGDLPKNASRSIRKSLKVMNRETQLGVAAGQKALADGDLTGFSDPERFGVVFGADNVSVMPEDFASGVTACTDSDGHFHPEDWGDHGIEEVAPLWLLKCLPNMPACHLAIINDLRGLNNTITQRDVAANLAIAEACRIIKDGDADAILVGATGTLFPAFSRLHAELEEELPHSSAPICRPFDLDRIGPGPGEGAAAFVLETLENALARGAKIYGEILGYASASLPGRGRPHACRDSLVRAMKNTLGMAGEAPNSIGHIHAHGLGTKSSDAAEAQAIQDVFDRDVPVVAAKGHFAHAGVGAGALEFAASLLALQNGSLFPTRNLVEQDSACPVNVVRDGSQPSGRSFLNLSMFGRGLASCVAVGTLNV